MHVPHALMGSLPKRERYQISCDQNYLSESAPDNLSLSNDLLDDFLQSNVQVEPLCLWSNTKANEKGKLKSWFYTLASTVQAHPSMLVGNLCHGAYRQKTTSKIKLTPWLWIAALALFSVSAELYLSFKHTTEWNQQADNIQSQSANAFLS